ncbi:MAG TPA: hypothetical protein VGD01_07265 [Candidatus Elarobacter sp.]
MRLRFDTLTRKAGRAQGIIDDLNPTGRPFFDLTALPNVAPRGATLYVSGWIYARQPALDPPELAITVDGAFGAVAQGGFARPDVAEIHGAAALHCGFAALLPTAGFAEGWHTVAAVQLVDAQTYRVGPERPVQLARAALRAPLAGTPVGGRVHVQLDHLIEGPLRPGRPDEMPVFGPEATIRALGWAGDLDRMQPAAAVYALVDGVHLFRGRYGLARGDVAAQHGCPQLARSGFDVRIDAGALSPGDHTVSVIALSADGEMRSEPAPSHPFSIRPD